MYNFYFNDKIIKFIHNWKDHVEILSYTDMKKSKEYEAYALGYIQENGEHSTNTASNFTLRMDNLIEGKFMNIDILRNNNLMRGDLEDILPYDKDCFISMGLDIGMGGSGDRTIATIAKNKLNENNYFTHDIKSITAYTYHKDETLDEVNLFKKTKQLIINNHVDFLLVDGTGLSKMIITGLNDYLKAEGLKVQVIVQDFSGGKKVAMYQYMENCFYNQKIILPKEDDVKRDRGWGLLFKEMLSLLKYKKGGNNYYSYEAPSKSHDDSVASLALCLYVSPLIALLEMERRELTLGKYTYIPRLKKAIWNEKDNKPAITNWLWL